MTLILATVFGLYFLGVGIALLLNPNRFRDLYEKILKDDALLYLGGILALLLGSLVVAVHNVWVVGWPLLITLLGWWSLIKGVLLMSYPDCSKLFAFFTQRGLLFYRVFGIALSLIGLLLIC